MVLGNLAGLPANMILFSALALTSYQGHYCRIRLTLAESAIGQDFQCLMDSLSAMLSHFSRKAAAGLQPDLTGLFMRRLRHDRCRWKTARQSHLPAVAPAR